MCMMLGPCLLRHPLEPGLSLVVEHKPSTNPLIQNKGTALKKEAYRYPALP